MILVDKVKEGRNFNLGGYAGTGKTTQIRAVHDEVPNGLFLAPTHAAAEVLRSKGIPAGTMHSAAYNYDEDDDRFYKKDKVAGDYIVCDEGSMLTQWQIRDLQSFGIPTFIVGDPFQLGPVEGELAFVPDHTLTEVHRHGGRILRRATKVREEGEWEEQSIDWDFVREADLVICGYNRTRIALTNKLRSAPPGTIVAGDQIMFLSNTKETYNGMVAQVETAVSKGRGWIVETDKGCFSVGLTDVAQGQSGKIRPYPVVHANARTLHKAQGSQAARVAVICQPVGDADKWIYTALTRAIEDVRLYQTI